MRSGPRFLYALNFSEPRYKEVRSIITWSFEHIQTGRKEGREGWREEGREKERDKDTENERVKSLKYSSIRVSENKVPG